MLLETLRKYYNVLLWCCYVDILSALSRISNSEYAMDERIIRKRLNNTCHKTSNTHLNLLLEDVTWR